MTESPTCRAPKNFDVDSDLAPMFHERGTANNCYLQSQVLCQVLRTPCLWFSDPPTAMPSYPRAFACSSGWKYSFLQMTLYRADAPKSSRPQVKCYLFREAFLDCPAQKSSLLHPSFIFLHHPTVSFSPLELKLPKARIFVGFIHCKLRST